MSLRSSVTYADMATEMHISGFDCRGWCRVYQRPSLKSGAGTRLCVKYSSTRAVAREASLQLGGRRRARAVPTDARRIAPIRTARAFSFSESEPLRA